MLESVTDTLRTRVIGVHLWWPDFNLLRCVLRSSWGTWIVQSSFSQWESLLQRNTGNCDPHSLQCLHTLCVAAGPRIEQWVWFERHCDWPCLTASFLSWRGGCCSGRSQIMAETYGPCGCGCCADCIRCMYPTGLSALSYKHHTQQDSIQLRPGRSL